MSNCSFVNTSLSIVTIDGNSENGHRRQGVFNIEFMIFANTITSIGIRTLIVYLGSSLHYCIYRPVFTYL